MDLEKDLEAATDLEFCGGEARANEQRSMTSLLVSFARGTRE